MNKLALALLLAASTTASACASNADGPTSGLSSLPARWWNWTELVPAAHNPVDDRTGEFCDGAQSKDVWFLAGTRGGPATRSCTVPKGEPIYFPVLSAVCEPTPGDTARQAIQRCSADVEQATASLDGKPLPVKEEDSGEVFTFTADALSQTLSEGRHDAVAWGVWVGPLTVAPGAHTLSFKGVAGSFSTSVTYQLTVR